MNTPIYVALIGGGALVIVTFIQGHFAKKAAEAAREAALGAQNKIDTVIHMVDGTQTGILEELKKLTSEKAGLAGELKGRDYTREHMEIRQDAIDKRE
jgi:hypothetical protein